MKAHPSTVWSFTALAILCPATFAVPGCTGGDRLSTQPARFALAPRTASVQIRLVPPARALNYLRVADWDQATATLLREGAAEAPLTANARAIIDPDGRTRRAELGFPSLPPGEDYVLRIALQKRAVGGELREVGASEQRHLAIAPGPNVLTLSSAVEPADAPAITPGAGLGPYVSSFPEVGVSALVANVQDVLAAGNGTYYFLDNGRIGAIYPDAAGQEYTRTLAGVDKRLGAGLIDGVGENARFGDPRHLAQSPAGRLFVADAAANAIREVRLAADGSATVLTVAGTGFAGKADGPAASATFNAPGDLACDSAGNLWVADTENHTIRLVTFAEDGSANVSTVAGTGVAGFLDGAPANAQFRAPGAITMGPDGDVYVGDSKNFRIRRLARGPDGAITTVSTFAGSGQRARFQDTFAMDDGPLATARLGVILALRFSPDGTLFVNDQSLKRVDGVGDQRVLTTIGVDNNVVSDFLRDPVGEFSANGFCFAGDGTIALANGNTIRKVRATGSPVAIRQWIGTSSDSGLPVNGGVSSTNVGWISDPAEVEFDEYDNIYLCSRTAVYFLPAGPLNLQHALLAGSATSGPAQDGDGENARFTFISGSCVLSNGDLLIADLGAHSIRRLTRNPNSTISVTTISGTNGTKGFRNGPLAQALFKNPGELTQAPDGTIFISENGNGLIRKIVGYGTPEAHVETVAGREPPVNVTGTGTQLGYLDGPGAVAKLTPISVTVLPDGNLVFVDDFSRIRKVSFGPAGPTVSTIAGGFGSNLTSGTYADGPANVARFAYPQDAVSAADGSLYVTDRERLRKITFDSLGRAFVSTVAGGPVGAMDGVATSATFSEFGGTNGYIGELAVSKRSGDILLLETNHRLTRLRRVSSVP